MKVKNLVYPIMIISTISGLVVWPYFIYKGEFSFDDFDNIYKTVGSFTAVYGSFIGSWLWWYKYARGK